jgi:excisionase family DNA binding protein
VNEPLVMPRLLSPEAAAVYLGLGSRWSIYRLVDAGELPRLKLAGKLRFDREDLDRLIDRKKGRETMAAPARPAVNNRARSYLAPLIAPTPRNGGRTVTPDRQVAVAVRGKRRASDIQSATPAACGRLERGALPMTPGQMRAA